MKEMWDKRYKAEEFVYGKEVNAFLKDCLDRLPLKGEYLFPAEGEGRNGVYAAQRGLSVFALDISSQGKKKALALAEEKGVHIKYEVGDIADLNLEENSFDGAVFISAHFPPHLRSFYHQKIARLIKPGGYVILEGFSKSNLPLREANPEIGGPKNVDMLFSIEEIREDFKDFKIVELQEVERELHEGSLHNGMARVIRFVGSKE
ncbi:MAG: class I SAM-dependent methyltransferase [Spirochaetaceae bacterium]|jgi:SAM-dependent methyltransferase|nr:class I SAM-dependent methyltransferase [Spirochaetaceae bacterium]